MLPCVACHDRACDADIVCVLEQVSRNGCGVGGEDHGSLLVDSLLQVIGEVGRVLYETERVGVAFLRENVCDGLIAGGLVAVGGGLSASRDAEADHDDGEDKCKKLFHMLFLHVSFGLRFPETSYIRAQAAYITNSI